MASNQDIKKPQRKADEDLPERLCKRGKQPFQKYKAYVVLQYLLKYTDEDNPANAFDIIGFLEEHGMSSDRRSIYQDIKEIKAYAKGAAAETPLCSSAFLDYLMLRLLYRVSISPRHCRL